MEKNKGHTEIKADIQVRDGSGKAVGCGRAFHRAQSIAIALGSCWFKIVCL
jgi:hypothetical protein